MLLRCWQERCSGSGHKRWRTCCAPRVSCRSSWWSAPQSSGSPNTSLATACTVRKNSLHYALLLKHTTSQMRLDVASNKTQALHRPWHITKLMRGHVGDHCHTDACSAPG